MTQGSLAEAVAEAAPAATEKQGSPDEEVAQEPSPAATENQGSPEEQAEEEAMPKKTLSTIKSEGALGKKEPGPLDWTGRPFGGFRLDIQRRKPYYVSDWTDAFLAKNMGRSVTTVLFLCFACISSAITFGCVYEIDTHGSFGVVETILAMAGQPITILGANGAIYAYTIVCYNMSKMFDVEFLPFYFWTLMWCSLFTVLMVAFDLCALMHHVTKFSEDIFVGLISIIFIVEAINPIVTGFMYRENGSDGRDGGLACASSWGLSMPSCPAKTPAK